MLIWPYYSFNVVSGAAVITGYHGLETGNLTIPGTLTNASGTYPVARTTVSAFGDSLFSSVTIPASMTNLDSFTFYNCPNMTTVVFSEPSSLTTIGDLVFCNCIKLDSINIPNNVTSILKGAFDNCQSLTTIDIPGGVTTLGDTVFKRCNGLTSAYFLGAKPTTFGSSVFESATTLYYHVKYAASWAGTAYNATPFCNLTLMDGATILSSGRTALDKTNYTLTKPADPAGGSRTFLGWYTAAFTPYDFTTPVSDDLTLYAIWGSPGVCSITSGGTTTDYATLDDALAAVKTGESIKLLQDISYNGGLSVSGKLINFELNGYNLNVSNTSGTGLEVGSGGGVSVTGSGQFNVTGTDYGVYAHDGGLAAVTSATSTGATGTGAKAASGGQITVNGSVSGASGVFATGSGSSITVNGGVSGTDENGSGAWAAGGASINISGDVQGGVYGVHAINAGSVIKVGGSVTATNLSGAGAYADNGGSITVGGNAVGTGGSGIGACALAGSSITVTGDVQGVYSGVTVQGNSEVFVGGNVYSGQYGVIARSGGEATIDGIISVGAGTAIAIGSGTYNVITPTTKDGYITYSDGTSTVWVKDNAVVEPTTFVLSNEEGNEIDWYQYSGYAGFSMYQFLVKIQEYSNGVITDEFLAALAACPANSAIFTTRLYDYRGQTQSICINSDGTVKLLDILGRDYYGRTGFTTCWDNRTNSGAFTYTNDPACYIDAGTNSNGESYKAFAVYWAPILENRDVATFVLTNEAGGLVDQLIADGYGDYNVYQTLELLKPSSGGVITDEFMASLAACPADSEIFTVPLTTFVVNYPLCINEDGTLHISPIYGRDFYQKPGYASYPDSSTATMMFTYPTSADYLVNAGIGLDRGIYYHYKAFGVAWAPAKEAKTFVLSNEEGGLIDQLIGLGYGNNNLFQVLTILMPSSGGVITEDFMALLAACPAGSEIFTGKLSNYTGLNNPVCINSDGTVNISGIFGRDYCGKAGYTTYPEDLTGPGREVYTYASSRTYYIDAGFSTVNGMTTYYKAFAIAWSPAAGSSAPAAPTIIPNGGTFTNSVGVTITGTGGTIYYTTDGTDPRESGTRIQYTGQFTLTNSAAVKGAVQGETVWSEVASQTFTITTNGGGNGGGGGDGGGDIPESVNTTPEQVEAPNEPGVKNPAAEPTDLNGHWAHDCIMALIANGIIRGYPDGTIRPEQEITRAEAAVLLVLSLGLQDYHLQSSQSPYNDYLPAWAERAILICTERGLMKGYPDGSFKPDQRITRAEMCVALIQAYPQVMQPGYILAFTDRNSIPEWARTFIERAAANQLVGGYPDGTFQPDAFIKRAEVFTIICHLKGYHSQHSS